MTPANASAENSELIAPNISPNCPRVSYVPADPFSGGRLCSIHVQAENQSSRTPANRAIKSQVSFFIPSTGKQAVALKSTRNPLPLLTRLPSSRMGCHEANAVSLDLPPRKGN